MIRAGLVVLLLLALAGCGATSRQAGHGVPGYEGGNLSCVPYARQRSGIDLRGDAWQWWAAATGRYDRSRTPREGSVLVLMRTSRLPQGHVAVVSRMISPREIRVDHANWVPAGRAARGRIARDQPVVDISPSGDWSLVRIWYPGVGDYGITAYPAHGFIGLGLRSAGG